MFEDGIEGVALAVGEGGRDEMGRDDGRDGDGEGRRDAVDDRAY